MAIIHQNITGQIINYFIDQIESEEWRVGEKIPSENQLTSQLGVSRASVRQAISQFVGVDVFETVHGKGTYLIHDQVRDALSGKDKITAEDLMDTGKVLEFRRIVESEACYMATVNRTEELVNELRSTLAIMVNSKDNLGEFVNSDMKFHQLICEASGNPLLEKIMNRIFEENKRGWQLTREIFGYHTGIHYHEKILIAIEEGDAGKAREAMYEHMQNGIERLNQHEEKIYLKSK